MYKAAIITAGESIFRVFMLAVSHVCIDFRSVFVLLWLDLLRATPAMFPVFSAFLCLSPRAIYIHNKIFATLHSQVADGEVEYKNISIEGPKKIVMTSSVGVPNQGSPEVSLRTLLFTISPSRLYCRSALSLDTPRFAFARCCSLCQIGSASRAYPRLEYKNVRTHT